MRARHSFAVLPLCTLAVALACSGDSSGPPAVATVDVGGSSTDLVVGQTAQLAATPRDAKGNPLTNRTTTWATSSAAVATVSSAGLVTAVTPGAATITATIDGKTGSRAVNVVSSPVAAVVVTATTTTIQAGSTTQLTAVALDANTNVLTGRPIDWTTSDASTATVSGSGLVTGIGTGLATITATSEGRAGSIQIVVDPPEITSVTPNPLIEGQAATITGSKFGSTPANIVVRVGGVPASVTSASSTALQIVVPAACRPASNINVEISVRGASSAPRSAPFRPTGPAFSLAPGQQRLLANPAEFCLRFDASRDNEIYLVGVQSVSENVTSVTPVSVTAEAPMGGAAVASRATLATAPVFSASLADPAATARAARLARHRALSARFLDEDRALLASRLSVVRALRSASRSGASASLVPTVPGTVKAGDVLNVRIPDRATNTCTNSIPIAATVKTVGTRSIILEDNANPPGGFTASDYQSLSDQFDTGIYATDVAYFGTPTDRDENARVVIIITKEVNKITNLLGQVFPADLYPQSECAASNEGEVFYGKAPDPTGTVNGTYSTADALLDAPIIIAHEFSHVIQLGRYIYFSTADALPSTWMLEGQATLAEEVNGYAVTGRGPGQNLGFDVAFNSPTSTPIDWFAAPFGDLAWYYGFETRTTKVAGAPEECSWLGTRAQGNDGPCESGRAVYGVPWSFLRWISDQFGPSFAGGEKAIHQQFIDDGSTGYATVTRVIGQPIDVLLAQWAAMLYLDDRYSGVDPKLTLPSWNLVNIESRLVEPARLVPRTRTFGTFTDQVSVRAGSTAYFLVYGPGGRPATGIRVRDRADGALPGVMRLWVVRLQ